MPNLFNSSKSLFDNILEVAMIYAINDIINEIRLDDIDIRIKGLVIFPSSLEIT